jgi:hypothetical protein
VDAVADLEARRGLHGFFRAARRAQRRCEGLAAGADPVKTWSCLPEEWEASQFFVTHQVVENQWKF